MKHLLNDLTEKEKNSIREQHTGGMNVVIENFSKLINAKSGDVKPLISEQSFKEELIKQGYKDITSWYLSDIGVVYIPDGEYVGEGTKDYVYIKTPEGVDTGYVLFLQTPNTRGGDVKIFIEGNGGVIKVTGKFNSVMLNENKLNSSGLSTKK